jgi:hypothetical protein
VCAVIPRCARNSVGKLGKKTMTSARSLTEKASDTALAASEWADTSWDARTQRMMARMGSAPPRPRDFTRRPPATRTQRSALERNGCAVSSPRNRVSPRNSVSPWRGEGAGEDRKPRRCEKTGENLKQAVPAKSSLGMAAVGVMSTSIGRAGAAAGARLGYEGMQLLISLVDIAEVQMVCGALVTVLLWEASSRKFSKHPQMSPREQRQARLSAVPAT